MEQIFSLLEAHRLQSYYNLFLQLGVKDEQDFIDSVTDEDLGNLGLTHVEKNRFREMQTHIRRLRAPVPQSSSTVLKSLKAFSLKYTYPKCTEPKVITDMDPAQNTVEDLMLRIGHTENIGASKGVCLFTVDGMPLSDDPFLNTWSLQDRHISDGELIYAIFTPKENLQTLPQSVMSQQPTAVQGTDTVRCHVMLKGDFEVNIDLESATVADLKIKLAGISGIPANVLHYRGDHGTGNTLQELGITDGTTVNFSLSSFTEEPLDPAHFFSDDRVPLVQQTTKGISVFLSSLYIIKNKSPVVQHNDLIGYIRKVTGCNPLAQSLNQMLQRNQILSRIQKIAVIEGLYTLFREILPKLGSTEGDRIIEDQEVFEYSLFCWSYLMSEAKQGNSHHEIYAPVSLLSDNGTRFCEPVSVPGIPGAMERADVIQKIKDDETIPLCTERVLVATALKRCTDIERILLSVHPSLRTYYLWLSHDSVTGQNFELNTKKSLAVMTEEMKAFPQLSVTPPLLLKNLGYQDPCLVYLSKDNLSVYLHKHKGAPEIISVYDCMSGKTKDVDVNILAAQTGDSRSDQSLATTRTPKEAILDCVETLEAAGKTKLYDALQLGRLELEKVKIKFPECRLRILCLTDGNDVGSTSKPADVAASLIRSDIIVDSVLVGKVENNSLHGISTSSGGCCFKPNTSKEGLKLFEAETVLSLEIRKLKNKVNPSTITEKFLQEQFAVHGYDDIPKATLPCEINNKVTLTEDALKKKLREAKDGHFMEKDRRILEELKNLHLDPHPYFQIFPSETDFTFWKLLMEGPPDTPYETGVFELFCQFGSDYPVKPPTVHFVTPIYHCNINNVGRICHNIFDRGYNAHITMREILDAVYGLLIAPEPEDPLDSILAEEFMTSPKQYGNEAKKHTEKSAGQSLNEMEKKLVETVKHFPEKLICPLSKKLYMDPVKTKYGDVYERKAIEKHLKHRNMIHLLIPQGR